ncbi:hypothetical protein MTO96_023636 [Rhipicephalus appendiculatus]
MTLRPELSGARSLRHLRALFHCSAPEKSLLSSGVVAVAPRVRAFDVLSYWSPEQQPEHATTVFVRPEPGCDEEGSWPTVRFPYIRNVSPFEDFASTVHTSRIRETGSA